MAAGDICLPDRRLPELRIAQVGGIVAPMLRSTLRAEFEARGIPVKDGRWGYRLLVVEDPDGNQLFLPYPNEPEP
jgi:hypothetical protein